MTGVLRSSAGALVAAAALATGCGGSGSSSSTGATHATASAAGRSPAAICRRVPASDVARLIKQAGGGPAPLKTSAHGTSALVQCSYDSSRAHVDFSVDLADLNRQRFNNRVTEMSQFSTGRPSTLPRPVHGVGDPHAGSAGADWIPALNQLLAYQPGRYLIADFAIRGASDSANRAGAIGLARLAFPRIPRSGFENPHRLSTPKG